MSLIREIMYCKPGKDLKTIEEVMKGYHDLIEHGRREIYKIEG